MYVLPSSNEGQSDYFQGDIVEDFPLLNLGTAQDLTVSNSYTINSTYPDRNSTHAAVQIVKRKVMIISQTCDAQRRDNIIVCPIIDLAEYISSNSPNADKLRSIRSGKIYYWFYLGALEEKIDECFVDLQQFIHMPRADFERLAESHRILSLSDFGRHKLAWSLSSFFGRPAEP